MIFNGAADDSPGDGVDARDGDSRHVAAEDEAAKSQQAGWSALLTTPDDGGSSGGVLSFELGGVLEERNERFSDF